MLLTNPIVHMRLYSTEVCYGTKCMDALYGLTQFTFNTEHIERTCSIRVPESPFGGCPDEVDPCPSERGFCAILHRQDFFDHRLVSFTPISSTSCWSSRQTGLLALAVTLLSLHFFLNFYSPLFILR